MRVKLLIAVFIAILAISCSNNNEEVMLNLIPYPAEVQQQGGHFETEAEILSVSSDDAFIIQLLNKQLSREKGLELPIAEEGMIRFKLVQDNTIPTEGYRLTVDKGVLIEATEKSGLLYGAQTLRQLLTLNNGKVSIPKLTITDYPRFAWRGMHFDVSRHFFSVEEIKQFLDYMAMNKLNTFHWHLVDDQGWRLEIKKYPKLTEIGAWRKNVGFTANQEKGLNTKNTESYGGYYTQTEVREIVAYASERNITIVPEIELPGHSAAALVAYPEYYCDNAGELEIWEQAGVSAGVYCAGKESTFQFLEDVLTETMELFPGEFIHIGGDETPKDTWLACPDCRKRMKEEGAHDEHELQSYFVHRIEKFLNKHNRRLIGWDEILDGGLAQSAAVMSWRGVAGGVKAAEAGHDVVMTPMFPYYFNHTQNHLSTSPGHPGISTLRDVYTFPSIPTDISPDKRHHVIGVQANMWSEYMPKFKHIEYNLFPRVFAIAEVAWSPAIREWDDFYARVNKAIPTLEKQGIQPGDISYHVRINVEPDYENKSATLEFVSERPNTIYYTKDGSKPTKQSTVYTGSFVLAEDAHIKACQFKEDGSTTFVSEKEIIFHKAFGKPYQLKYAHAPQYDGGGKYGLTNGFLGVEVGVEEKPIDLIIDMGEATEISHINSRYKNAPLSWVFGPKKVRYEVSADGKSFNEVASFEPGITESDVNEIVQYPAEFEPVKARYVRIVAENVGLCPAWHPAAGGKAWLFSDEVIVK
ncbi:family 20 glycosylhydrolase [Carboxylicivirga sp. A043]|uniref:glycoside hydrolase family 20 protein n=1 Tax=Carboxylicivirga litoralis TaxID=2816963 RepID=UPI0021CB8C28|nr:glycoside hydrolase family 20 protein [Carboxylicivirga sp. A043]MCU4155335.1 family 20 glycosylhydrolase [Carboxylicivirga sp. A043]